MVTSCLGPTFFYSPEIKQRQTYVSAFLAGKNWSGIIGVTAELNHDLKTMIPVYPDTTELSLLMRPILHPLLQQLKDGISEFTFANLFLFRDSHHYRISKLPDGMLIFCGSDNDRPFFMSPFGLPQQDLLKQLMHRYQSMKCVSESQVDELISRGCSIKEDRDNFDYLYRRQDLAELSGRKFSKKRNQIKAFINNYDYAGKPLLEEYLDDALAILDRWRDNREDPGDFSACREALVRAEELQLCGGIYYADDEPVGFSLGEELMESTSFAIHFEKAVSDYKGVWQFINQAFASILPENYLTINREQDLGNEGLRSAKMSYKPCGFIKKYRATLNA